MAKTGVWRLKLDVMSRMRRDVHVLLCEHAGRDTGATRRYHPVEILRSRDGWVVAIRKSDFFCGNLLPVSECQHRCLAVREGQTVDFTDKPMKRLEHESVALWDGS
jgi:hypothetical protein